MALSVRERQIRYRARKQENLSVLSQDLKVAREALERIEQDCSFDYHSREIARAALSQMTKEPTDDK